MPYICTYTLSLAHTSGGTHELAADRNVRHLLACEGAYSCRKRHYLADAQLAPMAEHATIVGSPCEESTALYTKPTQAMGSL